MTALVSKEWNRKVVYVNDPDIVSVGCGGLTNTLYLRNLASLSNLYWVETVPDIFADELPNIQTVTGLRNVKNVIMFGLPSLEKIPDMPAADFVILDDMAGLISLPQMPQATFLHLMRTPKITLEMATLAAPMAEIWIDGERVRAP